MGNRVKDKPCYWCGSYDNDNNQVTISEDVPPRWLSGIKKVKEINCVPQCETCKNNLAPLDYAVNDYFRYGAKVDLDKVERANLRSNNKGYVSRKIILNGNIDYAQSNGCLLLWLRKLLSGLWYKKNDNRFNGLMLILAPWLSFEDKYFFVCQTVIPKEVSRSLLSNIEKHLNFVHEVRDTNKEPFKYTFINSPLLYVPEPFQLLRFEILDDKCGYCLFIPEIIEADTSILSSFSDKPPLYINHWLRCDYQNSSFAVDLLNSQKSITLEEVTKRVRL